MRSILFATILAASMLAEAPAHAVPSTNAADYVLLAGQLLNARNLLVESGDLAVSSGELRSHNGIDAGSSVVAADQVDIDPGSVCEELFSNSVVETGSGCGAAAGLSGPIFPDLAAACGFPPTPTACDPSRPVKVAHKQTQTLPPGVYGDLLVSGGNPGRGTLILEGGEYVFCRAHLGPRARLLVENATTIEIASDVNFGLGSLTGPASGSGLGAGDLSIFVAGAEARFQRRADLVGKICVPDGLLWLMSGVVLEGQGVANVIRTGRMTVRHGAPGGSTTTITTPAPTTTSTSSSTSSTVGGATSTSTTSTSSTSTTGPGPSTTSTSTTSTTSTTGQTPSTTSTSTPGSSSSSTSTTSTTSTTIGSAVCGNGMTEAPETCDDGNTTNTDACPSDCTQDPCEQTQNASVVLSVNLVTDGGDGFGVGTVFVDYPEGLAYIPGSADDAQVQAAITDRPSTGTPTCLVNDRDHGLQFGCLSTSGFAEGLFFRAAFRDCQSPTPPNLGNFTCTVLEASDTIGFPVTATCSLQLQ